MQGLAKQSQAALPEPSRATTADFVACLGSYYDKSSTTDSVERARRQNGEFLRGKQHVDVRKWQSQCVLAARCRQHQQASGRAMTDYVQRLRRKTKLTIRSIKKGKRRTSCYTGNPAFLYSSEKLPAA